MLKMKKTITITNPYQNPQNTNFPTLPFNQVLELFKEVLLL